MVTLVTGIKVWPPGEGVKAAGLRTSAGKRVGGDRPGCRCPRVDGRGRGLPGVGGDCRPQVAAFRCLPSLVKLAGFRGLGICPQTGWAVPFSPSSRVVPSQTEGSVKDGESPGGPRRLPSRGGRALSGVFLPLQVSPGVSPAHPGRQEAGLAARVPTGLEALLNEP